MYEWVIAARATSFISSSYAYWLRGHQQFTLSLWTQFPHIYRGDDNKGN